MINLFSCRVEKATPKTGNDINNEYHTKSLSSRNSFTWNKHRNELSQDGKQQVGLAVYDETKVKYRRNDSLLMSVHIGKQNYMNTMAIEQTAFTVDHHKTSCKHINNSFNHQWELTVEFFKKSRG